MMSIRAPRSTSGFLALIALLACTPWLAYAAVADDVSSAQRRAAAEYLAAVASGSAQAVGFAIHPDEIDRLRLALLTQLREEAARGDGTVRGRLFGQATSLAEVERWTSVVFFTQLARRLELPRGRAYDDLKGVAAVRDSNGKVHVVARGRQPRDRGATEVVELVTLVPYGKDWKAALPSEIEAQIEDLIDGRVRRAASADPAVAGTGSERTGGSSTAPPVQGNPPDILAMLGAAEKALVDGRCDEYYGDYLSPNFRRTLSKRMQDALVAGCRNSLGTRESLIAALRIVKRTPPRLDSDGNRAVYDVSGQGLAFDRFVLERIERRWYVAE
jgi:hypothetical protein